jgi:hypothetical protein
MLRGRRFLKFRPEETMRNAREKDLFLGEAQKRVVL